MAACWQAARDADAMLVAQLCFVGAYAAEKLGRPWLMLNYSPMTPTAVFPSIYWPRLPNLGGSFNRFTHWIDQQSFWWAMRAPINRARRAALALPPLPFGGQAAQMRRDRVPVLYGFSSIVIPRPADWDPWVHVTGYWLLGRAPDWQPPDELTAFLRAGPPPVYLGLGSVTDNAPARFLYTILEGIARSGQRLILMPGKHHLESTRLPKETLLITATPHDWLFPQLAGVISHGGSGTLATGFQAGVPVMAIPFFGDQYFWGRRAHELGVGPAPIPVERVTAENVAEAVTRLATDGDMRRRAAELGARLKAEDGVANAVAIIQQYLS
jgi:UDP:flavonoid glycosyltransferase YjiC (YdhE family)